MARKIKIEPARPEITGEILTDAECAALLGVKRRTLRLWRQRRGIPFIKITSKEVRYRRADVDRWLSSLTVQMTGGAA